MKKSHKGMLRTLISLLLLTVSMTAGAKSMRELWLTIPDSLMPYVDKNHRIEMVEFLGMNLRGDVDNLFGSKSEMDTLTNDYTSLTLNEAVEVQLKRLPMDGSDSIVCMLRTIKGPAPESEMTFFTQDWQPLNLPSPLNEASRNATAQKAIVRPDTMSQARFQELKALLSPIMVSGKLFCDSNKLQLQVSVPTEYTDQKALLKKITPPMEWIWENGQYRQK